MAYDIGPRIGIEGESEFRKAIQDINMSMKTLGTEMQAVASQFDKNDKSTEALTAKNEVLNKQIETQKQKLSELQKGLAAAAEKYGENDKVTQGWQQAVNKATAELNNMERELKSNNNALEEVNKKTNKFTDALNGLGQGLVNAGKVAAKAAVVGITAIGTAAIGAAAGALKLATDVGKTADDLITLSNQTGLSTQQLQEFQYASRFVDVELETLTKSMAKQIKSMKAVQDGTKLSVEAYKALGVEVLNSDGSLRNSQTVYWEVIDALGKMQNETERDALAMQILGKSAQDLNPLIKAGSDELKRLSEEAHKVGAVLSDDTLAAAGQFDDMMQTLEASTKGLVATLGVAVIPAVGEVINTIVGVVPKVTEAIKTGDWEGAGQAVSDGVNGLLGKVTNALPGLATMASTIIGGLAGTIVTAIPQVLPPLIDATIQLLNVLVQILNDNGPMLVSAGVSALVMLTQGLIGALPEIINATITIVMALVDALLDALPELVPVAIQLIVTLAQGLIDALPKLIEKLPEIIETIVNVLVENLPLLVDAALQITMALVTAIIDNLPLLIEASIKIIGALVTGIVGAIPTLLGVVPQLFASLVKAFKDVKWGELGKNLIDGIVDGVKSAASNLANSVVNAAKNALSSVKGFLGIQSPSRVMRDQVGLMIGAGVAQGIQDSTKQIDAAMRGINRELKLETTINRGGISSKPSLTIINQGTIVGRNGMQEFAETVSKVISRDYGLATGGAY